MLKKAVYILPLPALKVTVEYQSPSLSRSQQMPVFGSCLPFTMCEQCR